MEQELRISAVELYKFSIPLKQPFITSLGVDTHARNVLVKIITENGLTGFGECSPYMPINGESVDTCCIVGKYFAEQMKGKNALDIEQRILDMDRIIYGNSSIKSAFDIALFDLAAQDAGIPLYAFIGGKNNKRIVTDYTVSIGDPDQMAADALRIKNEGYPAIKVKLGKNGQTDIERIRAIRNAVGNDIPIRIDANQGWQFDEAVTTLTALSEFDIEHCEEPIPRWDFMRLPELKKLSQVPIMADECCGDDHDVARLISIGACDYMNFKLGKSGGIFKALKMIRLAADAGIHLQVGAFVESRLAMTAFAHVALTNDAITHFDFDTALMFSEDPVTGGIVYGENGLVTVPDVPGLGASIDDVTLARMEKVVSIS